jgi:hypothetical protein
MNWRNGLLRLWLAVSLLWIVGFGWSDYSDTQTKAARYAAENICLEAGKNAEGVNPSGLDCYHGDYTGAFADLIPFSYVGWLRQHVVPAVLPPLGLLAFGLLIAWTLAGFKAVGGKL